MRVSSSVEADELAVEDHLEAACGRHDLVKFRKLARPVHAAAGAEYEPPVRDTDLGSHPVPLDLEHPTRLGRTLSVEASSIGAMNRGIGSRRRTVIARL